MDDETKYEKELAGYIADMLPLQYETFLENKRLIMGNSFFTENVPNPTPQQIAGDEAFNKETLLFAARLGANTSKKTVEVNSRNLPKDELILQLIHELVITEMGYEDCRHDNSRLLNQILPDAQKKLREALDIDFQTGSANDPRHLGGGRIVKGHLEQHIALIGQIIEGANDHEKRLNSIRGRNAVQGKIKHDPKQIKKEEVKSCWVKWQEAPTKYESKAAFARDMIEKYGDVLKSHKSIEDWCREWEKE
jgi:hypothetical protein